MAVMNVNPTRMELTTLKRKLVTARRGHKLLKDKRDELMRQFLLLVKENKALRKKVEEKMKLAGASMALAAGEMSDSEIEVALMLSGQKLSVDVKKKNIMSVPVPEFGLNRRLSQDNGVFSYGFAFTSGELDSAINALPKLALAPVLVILFGIGFSSKVILAFLMTVITAAISAWSGAKAVDPALTTLLFSLGAKHRQVFTLLVVPSAMPWIISGLRVNIALSMAGSIVGEFIASDRGLGRMIVYAGTTFDLKLVWVGVGVLSILSVLMYLAVVLLEKLLSRRWSAEQNQS